MEPSRIQSLQEALQLNPGNVFARYALAMELMRSPQSEQAWEHFEILLAHHPDYTATYLQAGMHLVRQGRRSEARQVLAKGIEVAQIHGDQHARSELEAAINDLSEE